MTKTVSLAKNNTNKATLEITNLFQRQNYKIISSHQISIMQHKQKGLSDIHVNSSLRNASKTRNNAIKLDTYTIHFVEIVLNHINLLFALL